MKTITTIFRSLFLKGQNNFIKILSLSVGLAMGLVLIAKVYLEQSYDDFVPDGERVYQIASNVNQQGEDDKVYPQVSGAIAPGMKAEIPDVEVATRFSYLISGKFNTSDKHTLSGLVVVADTCFFDIFPRPILVGDWKDVLSRPMYAMVSRTVAERMGGITQAIGQTMEPESAPGIEMVVGGVFEDIPENSHLRFDIIASMASIQHMWGWDSPGNWVGNDRYIGYVKLHPNVDPESLAPMIRRMQENNQPIIEIEKSGTKLFYTLLPLHEVHAGQPDVKRMARLLSMLAFIILFTAVMNYILIVISSLVNRSKEMAINKCYGASEGNIYGKMLGETFVHLIVSLILAFLIILVFRSTISELLDASLAALFSWKACIVMACVCIVVFLASGLAPGYLYARIPVSSAFRNYNETRRYWKLGLLFIQFLAAGFLMTLLIVISRQYTYMVNDNPGYSYENMAYSNLSGVDSEVRNMVFTEISRLPEVESVSSCYQLPLYYPSGNNILLPNDDRKLFNIADFYDTGSGYFDLMEIPIVEGRTFLPGASAASEVMVSRSFLSKMANFTDWSDGAIGKGVIITEHSQTHTELFTICGVYEDFRISAIGNEDTRPSVMFYSEQPARILLVKLHQLTPEALSRVHERLQELLPTREVILTSYSSEMKALYGDSRMFRDSVLIGGIVALLISLIGLIGYTNDEMNRRRKEVAIRKVNGATLVEIERLFLADITRISLPALILGGGGAGYIAFQWLDQFSEKISLSPALFITSALFVLLVITSVVAVNCYKAANLNPAESVKRE